MVTIQLGCVCNLGYFNFGEDHYTQIRGGQAITDTTDEAFATANCGSAVDLWKTDKSAYGLNGTYGES